MNSITDAALATFVQPLSQAGRLLQLTTPQGQELFALRAHARNSWAGCLATRLT